MAIADQPVPAAAAVFGGQQLRGGQGSGQLQFAGVAQHDLGPVGGVAGPGTMPPPQPLNGDLGERDAADPDHARHPGQHHRRRHVQQRPE